MFIDPYTTPGFRRTIFNAIVAPRPIGWISSMGGDGSVNLAPFSQFNLVSTAPPVVMFACNQPEDREEKDTIANVRQTGEFVVNLVSWNLREAMNITSTPAPRGVDEFVLANIPKAASMKVKPPRVAASPANLECRVIRLMEIEPEFPGETKSTVVFGRVLGLHIDEAYIDAEGRFDTVKAQPTTRLGGALYAALGEVVEIASPFKRRA
ncbi:flavin reductase family protein [Ottowia sp. VDI28]|uniref:flavin reductase family protein n=1 Tax=Ottowia sp. VDI28 TaxID=3133968 RepID=UPI003C2D94D6